MSVRLPVPTSSGPAAFVSVSCLPFLSLHELVSSPLFGPTRQELLLPASPWPLHLLRV